MVKLDIQSTNIQGIVHRDIKDENILIDNQYNVKLIDFGSASFIPKEDEPLFTRFLGTLQYASPEIFRGESYRGPEAEIWALGCCLYIMLSGRVPFETPDQAVRCAIREPKNTSNMCLNLLGWMLCKDQRDRPTIQQVASHEWLR